MGRFTQPYKGELRTGNSLECSRGRTLTSMAPTRTQRVRLSPLLYVAALFVATMPQAKAALKQLPKGEK